MNYTFSILLIGVALCAYFVGMWRKLDVYDAEIRELQASVRFWRELYEKAKGEGYD